jgi:hypothetical protein
MNAQTVAVANALAGERLQETVSYPVTGDAETDLISGFRALVRVKDLTPHAVARVLQYLLQRKLDEVAIWERNQQPAQYSPLSPNIGSGNSGGQHPGFANPPLPPWYTTAGGTGQMLDQAASTAKALGESLKAINGPSRLTQQAMANQLKP